jgi:hypothetical protein
MLVNDAFDVFIPPFVIRVLPFAIVVNETLLNDTFDAFILEKLLVADALIPL